MKQGRGLNFLPAQLENINAFVYGPVIADMWQQHQDKTIDYSAPLWSMLMFQMWWDKYMNLEHTAE